MNTRTVLITGITGFTGYHLLSHLQEADPELPIVGIDIASPAYDTNCEFIRADLLDCNRLLDLIRQVEPTHIFHLAGLNFSDDPKLFYDINVMGTVNLLEAVRKNRDRVDPKVLIVGSSAEYGIVNEDEIPISEGNPLRPISHYGVSKVAQDLLGFRYFRSCGLKVIRVRPFNLIGPGQSADFVCGALVEQISRIRHAIQEPTLEVGNLDSERDFIDIRDAVRAYWQLVLRAKPGEVYNVGSGKSHPIREILKMLLDNMSTRVQIRQSSGRMRPVDVPKQVSDISNIQREIGWRPAISLEESLVDTLTHAENRKKRQ
jgi:GDP-4-dehydro-6-deoxy-D-mannose reductase